VRPIPCALRGTGRVTQFVSTVNVKAKPQPPVTQCDNERGGAGASRGLSGAAPLRQQLTSRLRHARGRRPPD
jgi:hypothetical protein